MVKNAKLLQGRDYLESSSFTKGTRPQGLPSRIKVSLTNLIFSIIKMSKEYYMFEKNLITIFMYEKEIGSCASKIKL